MQWSTRALLPHACTTLNFFSAASVCSNTAKTMPNLEIFR
jgi:hypothetical protein